MAKKHYTSLGEQIDMASLAVRHSQTVALGNAKMNARGDILGEGGVVLRTQEQIDAEWRKAREAQQSSSAVAANIKDPFQASMMRNKKLTDDQDFDPMVADTSLQQSLPVEDEPPTATNGELIKGLVEKQTSATAPRRRKIVDTD